MGVLYLTLPYSLETGLHLSLELRDPPVSSFHSTRVKVCMADCLFTWMLDWELRSSCCAAWPELTETLFKILLSSLPVYILP